MRHMTIHSLRYWTLVLVGFLTLIANLEAGPPLLCHPFDIGEARSLPWAGGPAWNSPQKGYEIGNLVQDTIALLSPDVPIIVRMETLRRAAIYSAKEEQAARDLLLQLTSRALNAGASGTSEPLAWFDAGYLVETYKQAKWMSESKQDLTEGMNGYSWVTRAMRSGGNDPAMEFAASLMKGNWPNEHFQRAVAGATEGSLLARNLVKHAGGQAKTFAELQAKYK